MHCVWTSGDKWEMYIPSELGYGERGSPPKIGAGDVLVFTMEILKIKGDKVRTVRSVACDRPVVMVGPHQTRSRSSRLARTRMRRYLLTGATSPRSMGATRSSRRM